MDTEKLKMILETMQGLGEAGKMVLLACPGAGVLKFVLGMGVLVFAILAVSKLIRGISTACVQTNQAFCIWRRELGTGTRGSLTDGEIHLTIRELDRLIGKCKEGVGSPNADQ